MTTKQMIDALAKKFSVSASCVRVEADANGYNVTVHDSQKQLFWLWSAGTKAEALEESLRAAGVVLGV